jgi:hypothetical protein
MLLYPHDCRLPAPTPKSLPRPHRHRTIINRLKKRSMSEVKEIELSTLQAGEMVIVGNRYHKDAVPIKRATPKRIIIETTSPFGEPCERQFNNSTGWEIGGIDPFNISRITIPTAETVAAIKIEKRQKALKEVRLYIPIVKPELIDEVYDYLQSKGLI